MANAIRDSRRARTDYTQTFHVLEAIEGFESSAKTGMWTTLEMDYIPAKPMKKAVVPGFLD